MVVMEDMDMVSVHIIEERDPPIRKPETAFPIQEGTKGKEGKRKILGINKHDLNP